MSNYIHHVPGRLRIKTTQLKRNEDEASIVCKLLAATDGVLNCEVKTLTGSIVISYDKNVTNSHELVSLIKRYGYIAASATVNSVKVNDRFARTVNEATDNVGKAVAGFVLERAAAVAIGAII